MKLEDVRAEAPESIASNPADGSPSDNLDALTEAFGDADSETPDETEGKPGEGEQEQEPEGDEPDGDAAEDAGQDEGGEAPAEGDAEVEQPSAPFEIIEAPDPETRTKISEQFRQAVAQQESQLMAEAEGIGRPLMIEGAQVAAAIKALKEEYTAEDGTELPMTLSVSDRYRDLLKRQDELNARAGNLLQAVNTRKAQIQNEQTVAHNLLMFPKLQKYEKEYRQLYDAGVDCSNATTVYAACQALRLQNGGQLEAAPPKPAVTKAQVEQAALEKNLQRKQAGALGVGTKGAKPQATTKPKLSPEAQAELKEYERVFNGE